MGPVYDWFGDIDIQSLWTVYRDASGLGSASLGGEAMIPEMFPVGLQQYVNVTEVD